MAEIATFAIAADAAPSDAGIAEAPRIDAPVRRPPRWGLVAALIVVVAGGVAAFTVYRTAPGQPGTAPGAVLPKDAPSPSPRPQSSRRGSAVPAWVGRARATYARDGSKAIGFQVDATEDISVWMHRVRPRLVVRCLSHITDVYVVTGAAAAIEPKHDTHTVHVSFDNDGERVEQWLDSSSRQELFAPDGVELARRVSQAQTMRFGFTPYHASPVVVEFPVVGFDRLVGLVASTCGWRVDASRHP